MIYLIRHCSATGQAPEAPLTADGEGQARHLRSFLANRNISRIISSDYTRAMMSAAPFAEQACISLETDTRLRECEIGEVGVSDWKETLKDCIENPDLQLPGGEKCHYDSDTPTAKTDGPTAYAPD